MASATTPHKIIGETRALIVQSVQEVLEDPDLGFSLSARARKRLERAKISKSKTVSFSDIKRKYR